LRADPAVKKRLLNRCLPLAASSITWSHMGLKVRPAKMVTALLSHGADPNAIEGGSTALRAVAQGIWPLQEKANQQLREAVAVLIKRGATPDLFSAVAIGDEELVAKLLAQNPAFANARDSRRLAHDRGPLGQRRCSNQTGNYLHRADNQSVRQVTARVRDNVLSVW
jgi:hypothetical protein